MMSDDEALDPGKFRDALGRFATGVTIVTTRDASGAPVGVTANSYNSVSLDPPLVLWSLAKSSRSMQAFQQAAAFTIHVLAADQQELASRFASSGTDKFTGIDLDTAFGNVPLLPDCAAHFECESAYRYEGGDHIIIVGKVIRFSRSDLAPLIFHRGRFGELRLTDDDAEHADFDLNYLLARAASRFSAISRRYQEEFGLGDDEYRVLGVLNINGAMCLTDLKARVAPTGFVIETNLLLSMRTKGWIDCSAETGWSSSPSGRERFLEVVSRIRAVEDGLTQGVDPRVVKDTKALLRLIVNRTAV